MLQALGVLAFVVALLLSVMLHEFGHFIFAKKFGMKVTEFFLGFGYKIWSFTKGETEFGIKAIPAGGYCRIIGMSIHEEMSEEDKAKNWLWRAVGRRGEKRLVRGIAREGDRENQRNTRGGGQRGRGALPSAGPRRGTWNPRGRGGGGERSGGREDLLEYVRGGGVGGAWTRLASKRNREGDEEEEERTRPQPPEASATAQ